MLKSDLKEFNHIAIGGTIGLIVPIAAMQLILSYYSNFTIQFLIDNPLFSSILNDLKGCLFINLAIFFLFYWLKKDKSARGVVLATLLYAAFYFYYMFFM